ncbi:MAG: hypothetical protein U0269_19570 [Polyangiales bacterium]
MRLRIENDLRRAARTVGFTALFVLSIASCDRPEYAAIASASTASTRGDRAASERVIGRVGGRTVVARVAWRGPEASDAPERIELGWRTIGDGLRPIDAGAALIEAAVWDGSIVAITADETLIRIDERGQRDELDRAVTGELAVSDDGRALAYARSDGNDGALWVRRRGAQPEAIAVARGFASVGTMRFSSNGAALCFVGARNGGVLGVHVASATSDESLRCLTNCALQTGTDWQREFIEPPASSEALQCGAESVRWMTRAGQHVAIAIGGER